MSRERRRAMVDRQDTSLSIVCQCTLLGISRSGLYYQPEGVPEEDLTVMRIIDRQYLSTPFYGARRMVAWLRKEGHQVNRKRIRRLLQVMGLRAIYRRPRTSKPAAGHRIHPYLLRGMEITRPNQVWAADITYIPMARGFLYLVVIMDWFSRYVLSWRLSNTLDADFCIEALEEALRKGRPDIFNTDQGAQFTSEEFTGVLERHGVKISMDGRGSYSDNLFIERLWRTVKYEEVYLKAYQDGREARAGIGEYFRFYDTERPHQALGYRTPAEVYGNPVESLSGGMIESLIPIITRTAGPALNRALILSK
jgi:putative transposase